MKKGSSKSKRKTEEEKREDEVEKMLQAAHDEVLLNLSLNSHIAHASPSAEKLKDHDSDLLLDLDLDLDLQRRFQALKTKSNSSPLQPQQDRELENDLSARFSALKAKSSSVGPTTVSASNYYDEEESEDEETQVQKLIEWAKDAARLDPSSPSDHEPDT
ncbi:hypothetical protein VNO77_41936 [Canavalia gladiata]|uniref:Uncharacterized protein n=1 Tax=Canavalia gladiata TaxID=3824 RepID=A0AAN9K376_CANGL